MNDHVGVFASLCACYLGDSGDTGTGQERHQPNDETMPLLSKHGLTQTVAPKNTINRGSTTTSIHSSTTSGVSTDSILQISLDKSDVQHITEVIMDIE